MIKTRNFDVELATKFGLNNAIFLQDLAYWIEFNKKKDHAFRDGRYWTYSTMDELSERHPYWTKNQVRHIIDICKSNGWILVEHYDQKNYNRRNWYSISDDIMSVISFGCEISCDSDRNESHTEVGNIAHRSDSCFSSNISKEVSKKRDKKIDKEDIFAEELFVQFWSAYPRKVARKEAIEKWNKLKPDEQLLATILSALERQKQTEQWQNPKYIKNPASWLHGRRWEDEVPAPEIKNGVVLKHDGYDDLRLLQASSV